MYGDRRVAHGVLVGNLKDKDHLEDLGVEVGELFFFSMEMPPPQPRKCEHLIWRRNLLIKKITSVFTFT